MADSGYARMAANVARSLMTSGPGTAMWVQAAGSAVTAAMFPGEPGIFGDAQPQVDAANLIVIFISDHVRNDHSHPRGHVPPPAVSGGAIVDTETGQAIVRCVHSTAEHAATWQAHMASLGNVTRVDVQ